MKRVEGYIRWLNKMRADRHKALALILVMSLAVSGNVFWFLRGIGTALTDDPVCGLEEHTHTDDCYETTLICGYDEDVDPEEHVHTDECYETVLTCGKDEHTHTDECYADNNLHETPSVWESTIPDLVGDVRTDLVSVAQSQAGYEEGEDGYSRYGDWYGNPNGGWNVMFVAFCLHYAGIDSGTIPYGSGCWAWQVKLEEAGLIKRDDISKAALGDILLMDDDGDGKCDLAGIVADITDGNITLVEGDVDGKVDVVTCKDDDAAIYGFVSVGQEEELEPEEVPETVNSVEYKSITESGLEVTAVAPEGAFDEGVTMTAADIEDEAIINRATGELGGDREVKGAIAVDITFINSEGNEVEPADGSTVNVNISIPNNLRLSGDDYQLFHVNDNGVEEVKGATVSGVEASFETDGFSIFVMTATGERNINEINAFLVAAFGEEAEQQLDPDGNGYIDNSQGHPYYMKVGETVDIIGRVSDGSTPSIDYFYWYGNPIGAGIVDFNVTSAVPGEIKATVTALAPGEAALQLSGTNETFSIRVLGQETKEITYDFDKADEYDGNPAHIPEIHVHYLDHVILAGTRPEGTNNFPYKAEGNENPFGWVITTNPNRYQLIEYGNNKIGRRLYIDQSDTRSIEDGPRGNEQIITYHTAAGTKKVKIIIDGQDAQMIDHADIEIADGGVYTNVSFDIGDHGLVKTETKYQSYVHSVNSCRIYDSNNQPVSMWMRHQSGTTITYDPYDTTEGHFITGDYWHDPRYTPGMSQYELTSKYYKTDPASTRYIFNNKRFYYGDVDHVTFDVELQIIPMEIETFEWNGTGWDKVSGEKYTIDYENGSYVKHVTGEPDVYSDNLSEITEVESSTVFELGRRYVIDAYNKCPNHTGLDFTVHANHASVKFGATKELTNGRLNGNDFLFQLVDTSVTPNKVIEEHNDSEGKILFGNIEYTKEGTYTYVIREVPGNKTNIEYDDKIYEVTVVVSEKTDPDTGTKYLIADVSEGSGNYSFKFTNHVIFKLPDTGGIGTAPYMITGVATIGASVTLMILRRRKEVDL